MTTRSGTGLRAIFSGVIATIVDTISRAKGASIDEIVEVLVKTFPVMLMA